MKTKLILTGLLTLSQIVNAQFGGSLTQANPIYRDGQVVIGPNGLAPSTTPTYQLEVAGNLNTPDGIYMSQAGIGDVTIFMDNVANTGVIWQLNSLGAASPGGPGFSIYDASNTANRFYIDGTIGNVGIGTIAPSGKLSVEETSGAASGYAGFFDFKTNAAAGGTGIKTTANRISGSANNQVNIGLEAQAECSGTGTRAFAVKAVATGGVNNYGGNFQTINGGSGNNNYGVYGTVNGAAGANFNAAVYGNCTAFSGTNDFAGYFDGKVYITGAITSVGAGMFGVSDRKLKNNIRPLVNSLDKLKLLKPSTYTFRTTEFENMNLPSGEQMGLIAQDLEEVFPALVTEVGEHPRLDAEGKIVSTITAHKAVNYTALIPLLIASIQEQQKQIDEQKALISGLQKNGTANGISQVDASATGFKMEQNIPNPFTHETLINYTLPQNVSSASMIVYDMSGKQLSALAIDPKVGSLTITSEKLAAGMYLYSIIADGKVLDTKRMIVSEK